MNPLSVAAIRSVIDMDGTMTQTTPAAMTIQMTRHEDGTLSGLQTTNPVMNSTATQSMNMTMSGSAMSTNETVVTTNLQVPSSPSQRYPLGGKIVATGTQTMSGITTNTFQYQREMIFDGTSVMTVKMTVGTFTSTCKIDLANPGTAPNCS
jgi:nicotinate-nucleotide pyrophosphorylase